MSISQWYALVAVVVLAPHMSPKLAFWGGSACILLSIFGPFIAEWMSK